MEGAGLLEPAPGAWPTAEMEGYVLLTNTSELDVEIQPGDVVGGVALAYVQSRSCNACDQDDADAILVQEVGEEEPAWTPLPCEACGSEDVVTKAWFKESSSPIIQPMNSNPI